MHLRRHKARVVANTRGSVVSDPFQPPEDVANIVRGVLDIHFEQQAAINSIKQQVLEKSYVDPEDNDIEAR